MKKMKLKNYTAPTVKTVAFQVEHGFAGSPNVETRSIDPQTGGDDGNVPGDGEQYSRVTFDGWGSQNE